MQGLTSQEAAARLRQHGHNELAKPKKHGAILSLALSQFCDVLVVILLIAASISLILGDVSEALTIGVILLLNALLGFFQEYSTERALEKLNALTAPQATVLRDGKETTLDATLLVPDDIVLLSAGDRIPADGVLLTANSFVSDESMLTGESVGVAKSKNDPVFSGCIVTQGNGLFRITATGANSEMGKIAGMLAHAPTPPTPLQIRLAKLGGVIGVSCILICLAVAICGILRGYAPLDMLLTGVSLAVAAVPEGLPAIVTVALALAVRRMVSRRALIRKLHAVETLGCATVVCSDKTGTLTQNRMEVKTIVTPDGNTSRLLTIAKLCNNATETTGEPTERALFLAAKKQKVDGARISELPFDSERKRMSVLVHTKNGKMLYTKGAPDLLLPLCTRYESHGQILPLTDEMRSAFERQNVDLASGALRVLAFAYRESETLDESDLIYCGLAGLMDPPRKDVKAAVKTCRKAGIRPVMVTGDHVLTARAIAEQIDIFRPGDAVLSGSDLDRLSDTALTEKLAKTSVFARVTPAHKLRIVRAFQKSGEVVAMTGDGVNDAPAVREADIGVAMGKSGTDVTREAAGVVLLDDSFGTLVRAAEEGRGIYANIRKFIRYLLSCNIGEVCTMFFAMLVGLPIPLLPIQILFVNLVTDGLPAVALGLEPTDPHVMQHPPRGKNDSVFSGGLGGKIVARGLMIGLATLLVFTTVYHDAGLRPGRTAALCTLIFAQLFHVFECKSETAPLWKIPLANNPALIGAVFFSAAALLCAIYIPFLAGVFELMPLDMKQFLLSTGVAASLPVLSGLLRKRKKTAHSGLTPKASLE
ncbi:MAG: cation-translocating P-type ATPase [Ruminococcaceae bacterium]|nr:cation-translocating P-type ATPase [Oscillospiraceae bacterium]